MSSLRFTGLLALCAALAACDRPTPTRDITAPRPVTPSFDAAAATDAGLGPHDLPLVTDDAAPQQAATRGRAGGHADAVAFGADRRYSFTALSTASPPPSAAKGNVEFHIVLSSGDQAVGKGDVLCMTIVGNRARIAALFTSFRRNNVELPIPPTLNNLVWTVEDNGEGANDPRDRASIIFQTSTAGGQFHCAVGFGLPLEPNNNGTIQVNPE
jgi:hypothetical protein